MLKKSLFCIMALSPSLCLASNGETSGAAWEEIEYPYFSIRCSKGPYKRSLGTIESHWNEFVYLKWDGKELTRLRYSSTLERPHHWYNDESVLALTDQSHGGDSEIDISAQLNKDLGVARVDIDLDASEESKLLAFISDFMTYGSWVITKSRDEGVSLSESTAYFSEGKLVSGESDGWENCRLMDEYGREKSFGI